MPDITMCEDEDCIMSSKCYRFMVTPDPYWQSYTKTFRIKDSNEETLCSYYEPLCE